jgi:hypothetical protein
VGWDNRLLIVVCTDATLLGWQGLLLLGVLARALKGSLSISSKPAQFLSRRTFCDFVHHLLTAWHDASGLILITVVPVTLAGTP